MERSVALGSPAYPAVCGIQRKANFIEFKTYKEKMYDFIRQYFHILYPKSNTKTI